MQDTYHGVCCVVTVGEGLAACPGHSSRCCPAAAASLPAAGRAGLAAHRVRVPRWGRGAAKLSTRRSVPNLPRLAARLGRETRAGAPGCLLPHLGDLSSLTLYVAPRSEVLVVLSLMWSPWCHKCHCAECGDGVRPPGGGPLRLLSRLSLTVGPRWRPGGRRTESVTRSHGAEVRVTAAVADRKVLWSRALTLLSADRCHAVTQSRAAWSRRGCWHATDCGLAPAAARSLAPAARSHRWRLARQRGPAHAHNTPHILLALGQAGGRLGRGGGRTRD